MQCKSPGKRVDRINGTRVVSQYPCGQCMPCRITRRQEWVIRLLLEMRTHQANYFVTLTYDDEHVRGKLEKKDLQLYLKRLRKKIGKFRYFAVGEYGEKTHREHYHILIFADEQIPAGKTVFRDGKAIYPDSPITNSWNFGFVHIVPIITHDDRVRLARYTCGYVLKKMGNSDNGEFALMSRRPGIGTDAADEIAHVVEKYGAQPLYIEETDGPEYGMYMLRYNGKLWPLNKTMREKIIAKLGGDKRSSLSKALINELKMNMEERDPVLREARDFLREQSDMKAMRMDMMRRRKRQRE